MHGLKALHQVPFFAHSMHVTKRQTIVLRTMAYGNAWIQLHIVEDLEKSR